MLRFVNFLAVINGITRSALFVLVAWLFLEAVLYVDNHGIAALGAKLWFGG